MFVDISCSHQAIKGGLVCPCILSRCLPSGMHWCCRLVWGSLQLSQRLFPPFQAPINIRRWQNHHLYMSYVIIRGPPTRIFSSRNVRDRLMKPFQLLRKPGQVQRPQRYIPFIFAMWPPKPQRAMLKCLCIVSNGKFWLYERSKDRITLRGCQWRQIYTMWSFI